MRRGLLVIVEALVASSTITAAVAAAPMPRANSPATMCVGIVVDPTGSGSSAPADSACVRVPRSSTGADVLIARAHQLHRPVPRYRDGMLCAIDGFPAAPACGQKDPGGGYDYWSYWHQEARATTWSYSNVGADSYSVSYGEIEGWSFQAGGAEQGRRPPAAVFTVICPNAVTPPAPSRIPLSSPSARASSAAARISATGRAISSPGNTARSSSPSTSPELTLAPALVTRSPAAVPSGSKGVPWGPVAGAAGVLAIGAAAFARARRSRP